jgi:hypothetical protein
MNFQARDPLPNKKNSPGPFISNNYRQTVQGPAEKLVDLLRLHLHQVFLAEHLHKQFSNTFNFVA